MARWRGNKTVTIALVAVPQTAPAVLYSLLEIFTSVGTVWEELTGKPGGDVRMQPRIVAERAGLIHCGMDEPVLADASFDSKSYQVVISTDAHYRGMIDFR